MTVSPLLPPFLPLSLLASASPAAARPRHTTWDTTLTTLSACTLATPLLLHIPQQSGAVVTVGIAVVLGEKRGPALDPLALLPSTKQLIIEHYEQ